MPLDLAIDPNTRDLVISPRGDFSVRTGNEVVKQRIINRLRIPSGEWHLDPTGGVLGSRMKDLMRMPTFQVETDAPRVIREALEPMDDIIVHDVDVSRDVKDSRKLNVTLSYSITEPDGTETGDEQTLSTNLSITE